jgi:hypothetical protein
MIDNALEPPLFGLDQREREMRLEPILRALTLHHIESCEQYRNMVRPMFPTWGTTPGLEGLPFVPVGLFKRLSLKSVPDEEVFKTITSSGTTGTPSRVFVDRETANRQTRALTSIMGHVLGPGRRPMLVIDTDQILTDRTNRTARAAGVVGLMGLGRHHTFALDGSMEPQPGRVAAFIERFSHERLLIFGFTFMVWKYLVQAFAGTGLDLSRATLIHSGGWKQMEAERVDNDEFRKRLHNEFGISHVVNFYGMAEQVGSVFVEGNDGLLHPCSFADVIIRDPLTFEPVPLGDEGLIQVLSAVPTSYPGHSILTEDLGRIETVDDPRHGLGGKAFRVLGRLPKSELRGCSDTFAAGIRA